MNAMRPDDADRSMVAPAPGADLVAIAWSRIQVSVHLRPLAGVAFDPLAFRLEPAAGGVAMPPTRATAEDEDVLLRFNVMLGPGQAPLEPGRWRLVVAAGDGSTVPVAIHDRGPLDPALHTARFALIDATYEVVPGIDAADRALEIAVRLLPGPPAEAPSSGKAPGSEDADESTDEPSIGTEAPGERGTARHLARRLVRRGGRLTFRIAIRLARLAGRNGRRILFTSDSRGELGGNMKLVYDRIVERSLDRDYQLQTLFRPSINIRRSLGDTVRLPWLLGRADTIVVDDFQPIIYRLDLPDVRIVQLWHAVGAFKTVGYSRIGKPGAPNPWGRVHKNYSLVTVSARADVPIYAEAFGIPEDRVIPTGIPRTDRFFDPEYRGRARELALAAFPEARGRRVILFAPTFRGHSARTATYDLGHLDYPALHGLCVEKDAVCIVRMHPFVPGPLGIPAALGDRLLDGSRSAIDINDLLFAVDVLVTDYSSIVYEFSTLGRPMLFYAWDLEEYIAGRDFYEPYEAFVPGRIVRTFPDLLDAIRNDDFDLEKVASFAQRHFEHRDARSTDRVIDLILGP